MFAKKYPSLNWWIEDIGTIEMGSDEHSNSWLRVLNEGGLVWEDEDSKYIDDALEKANEYIKENYEE